MSTTSREIAASPEAIWAVLADAHSYTRWVLGFTEIIAADPEWPTPGSTFEYAFRCGPFGLRGRAAVLQAHAPRHLRLRWRRGVLVLSTAEILVEPAADPESDRSVLRIRQEMACLFAGRSANPFVGGLIAANDLTT